MCNFLPYHDGVQSLRFWTRDYNSLIFLSLFTFFTNGDMVHLLVSLVPYPKILSITKQKSFIKNMYVLFSLSLSSVSRI